MKEVLSQAEQVALTDSTVLIQGETGKEKKFWPGLSTSSQFQERPGPGYNQLRHSATHTHRKVNSSAGKKGQ